MEAAGGINKGYEPILTGQRQKTVGGFNEAIYGIFNRDKGVNGEIDEAVFQGYEGDCWLISGILSLSYTDEGSKLIKNAISENKNGDYEVYFKGIDRTYTVTKEELEEANKSAFKSGLGLEKSSYSTGDDDMLLIELAVEKIVNEGEIPIETIEGITGGSAYYLYQLFTDNETSYACGEDSVKDAESLLNYYKKYQDSCAMTLGIETSFANLEDDHAYAVKSYSGDSLTLVNPWDSTKEIKVSTNDLLDNIENYDISITDTELKEQTSWQDEWGYA